ncbi:helix-turn-helix transcriptional regulator [Streptomyces lydicus]|nr:helix-turn-helix transcriptional regulator [Streptomyces lydicus]
MELLVSSLMLYQAGLALRRGNVTEALATAETAADQASSTGRLPYALTLDTLRIDALLAQGRTEAAERIAGAHAVAGQAEAAWERPRFLMSLAALRIAQGNPRAGLSLLRECGHHCEAAGTISPAMAPWRSRSVAAHLALGDTASARTLAEQELDLARRCRIPRALGVALRVTGSPRAAPGMDLLAEAVDVVGPTPPASNSPAPWTPSGPPCCTGTTGGAPGVPCAAGWTSPWGAAPPCSARACRSGCTRRRAGRQSRGRGGRDADRGEERVGTLAAQGYSNKQIAELLVVSLRTVETHLTGAYRKLGIAGRPYLAAAMAAADRSRRGSGTAGA